MNLRPPTFAELREILANLDADMAREIDAFQGAGQWTVDSEAARLANLARELPAHVILDEQAAPVVAFGVWIVRPGVLQTWFTGRVGWQAVNAEVFEIHAGMRDKLFALPSIHRAQAYSLAGRERVRPWFERLGYTHEGVQRAGGVQREDLDLYGLVKGD